MGCPTLMLQSFIWVSLMAAGVQYEVTHIVSRMCVVLHSTVLIPCKYRPPLREQVSSGEWLHQKPSGQKVSVSQDPAFEGRVNVISSEAGNCSLLLRDVRGTDAGLFFFVFTASGKNWTNAQGICLEITDAEVEVNTPSDVVTEGDWILFTCGSCIPSMTVPTYTWRKDGELRHKLHADNMLYLESVEPEDGGRYLCIISGHEGLNSTHVNIPVRPGFVQRAALHTLTGAVAGCGGLIFIIIVIIIIIVIKKKRTEGGAADMNQKQTADDTYTALDPQSRSSADIYSTISSRSLDDTYTTLDLQSRSSEYETLRGASADPH